MQAKGPLVSATVLSALPSFLKARGVDASELFQQAQIDPAIVNDRDATVTLNSVAELFDLAGRRLDDRAFGLSYALAFPPGGTGLLGQMVLSAPTVRDVFDALQRYLAIHLTPVEATFSENNGVGRLEYPWPSGIASSQLNVIGFYTACLIMRLRQAAGPTWMPLRVEFQHREPEAIERYREMFGTRLSFEHKTNAVIVDITTLSKRMPVIYEGLHESLRELSEHKIRQQSRAVSFADRLQAVLQGRLMNERPFELEAAAKELALQPRALQWRLEQEGTSYEKVLLATRIVEADRYLRDSDHPLTRIAILLGFSELSAFTRWAQRRFHATPTALRARLRKGGSLIDLAGDDPSGT